MEAVQLCNCIIIEPLPVVTVLETLRCLHEHSVLFDRCGWRERSLRGEGRGHTCASGWGVHTGAQAIDVRVCVCVLMFFERVSALCESCRIT